MIDLDAWRARAAALAARLMPLDPVALIAAILLAGLGAMAIGARVWR